ncbi:hypothetical protein HHK36_025053 [Tetracentron sinense]|uniref:Late embryogenesis abundant protein LEA-2 subgroup domain-containing protein n=1 Tax=Tetracentron sinense TaxID=13715 RepID=A0A835D590_TETSI|nr:hypothetical protein HHK36_025053 [Tetracentron sinense]
MSQELNPHPDQPTHPHPPQKPQELNLPPHHKTNKITWYVAYFCAILSAIVIIGGLAVLIVYLSFRPKSPRFDISTATLNAAYLDMGYLLNADITVLANFTNPNKKVTVGFRYMVIDLYYGNTLIATQSIEHFSEPRRGSKLQDVHMVSSQVLLPEKDIQRFKKQMEGNQIAFDVKGVFRTRSNLGTFIHYSYWLYGKCSIVLTGPPSGVLVSRKCRTKR